MYQFSFEAIEKHELVLKTLQNLVFRLTNLKNRRQLTFFIFVQAQGNQHDFTDLFRKMGTKKIHCLGLK